MKYNTGKAGTYTVLYLDGDVDLSRSPAAREQILQCLDDGQHLLIDLSAVYHIDSSGVASLVEGHQTAQDKGLRFGLVGVSSAVFAVLQLARLDKILTMHTSVEERLSTDG